MEVAQNRGKIGEMMHKVLSVLGLLFCFSAVAQKSRVVLSASKTKIEVGETIAFKVESNIEGSFQIDNIPSSFVNGGGINGGVNYQMDYNTGNLLVIYSYAETGAFTKPGIYKIGPAYVKSRSGQSYVGNVITIEVSKKIHLSNGDPSSQQLAAPAFGMIQLNKTSIYEGESIIVGAKVYSRFQPTRIGNYNTFIQRKGIEFQELKNSSRQLKVREEKFHGNMFYTFEYDRNLIFPPGTGSFTLDPFSMDVMQGFKGYSLQSSGASIEIKPLPNGAPDDFIGAVGSFSVSRRIDTTKIKQGEVFKMTVEVSGTGNIQNSLEPELNLPKGFVVYGDPIVTKDISYGVNGAEGTIEYEFNIQVTTSGSITIPGTSISYFDLEDEVYKTVTTGKHAIEIERDKSVIAEESEKQTTDEAIYKQSASELRIKKEVKSTESIFGSTLFWSGVSAPLLCAFLFIFLVRKREKEADEIETKQAIQRKDKELNELMASVKSLLHSGENDAYYSSIESALRKAFELKMGITDNDRILNKSEMFDFLKKSGQVELLESVRSLFRTCEESRFGFGVSAGDRQPALNQLESIIKALKL